MRGQNIIQEEPISSKIGLFDIDIPSWPFLVAAGMGGLIIGVLIGKVLH